MDLEQTASPLAISCHRSGGGWGGRLSEGSVCSSSFENTEMGIGRHRGKDGVSTDLASCSFPIVLAQTPSPAIF